MRDVSATLLGYLRAEAPKLVHLVEIETGIAATPTLRYASVVGSVSWNGQAWTGRPFDPGEVRVESQGNAGGPTVEVADVDQVFRGLIAQGATFGNRYCILRLTVAELLLSASGPTTALRDDFLIDGYELPEGRVRLTLKPMAAVFDTPLPRGRITRAIFPGIPRDATVL